MIEAPDWLWPDAVRAFGRITDRLTACGEWHEIYMTSAAVAASAVATYKRCCESFGPHAATTQETRTVARLWLVDMQYLHGVSVARFDAAGCDLDLLELCA